MKLDTQDLMLAALIDLFNRQAEKQDWDAAYTAWVATRRYHSVIFQRLLAEAIVVYLLVVIWNLWGIMQALKVL